MYRFINYIIDFCTGYNIRSELSHVLEMDSWSRDQIIMDQKMKFERLRKIASTSDYYRSFGNHEHSEFPVMERSDFKINMGKISTRFHGPYITNHTSGSTSNPVTLLISKEMLLAKRVAHQKMLKWYRLERESAELKIGGPGHSMLTTFYYYLKNKRYFDSFHSSEKAMEKIIRTYTRFRPAVLCGYPSSLYNFAQYAEAKKYQLIPPGIIVTHAENLYKETTEKLARVFRGASVVNQYWATEANIAVTCPHGNLHMDEDTVICEVINQDQNGVGDLLITNLYSFHQPIIRYKIGDRVKLSGNACTCGRKTTVIDHIEGRETDYIVLNDNRTIPVTAISISGYAGNVVSYQLIYYPKKQTIEFCYIPVEENAIINENGITNYFNKNFGLSVCFTKTSKMQLTKAGKFRKLIVRES